MRRRFFFEWLKRVKSITDLEGVGDELYLCFKNAKISAEDLRELVALFYRYKIDMKQLKIFLNEKNKEWFFENRKSYWHRKVFGLENNKT